MKENKELAFNENNIGGMAGVLIYIYISTLVPPTGKRVITIEDKFQETKFIN